jgi:hypothetical protein
MKFITVCNGWRIYSLQINHSFLLEPLKHFIAFKDNWFPQEDSCLEDLIVRIGKL